MSRRQKKRAKAFLAWVFGTSPHVWRVVGKGLSKGGCVLPWPLPRFGRAW